MAPLGISSWEGTSGVATSVFEPYVAFTVKDCCSHDSLPSLVLAVRSVFEPLPAS
jgi:hypothetical protein